MAQAIGIVNLREGSVFARSADGSLRELASGDAVFQGEVLVPAAGAEVELVIADMPSIQLLGETEMLLSAELLAETADSATDAAVEDPTIAAVVAALEGEGDILESLEAPAAGGGRDDEGSSFIRLGRIGFDLPEFAGFRVSADPELFTVNVAEADNDLQLLLDDEPEAPAPPSPEPPLSPNLAPDAVDDSFVTPFGQALDGSVLGNDTDPEGDALVVSANGEPSNGTVTIGEDGAFSYTPNAGFSGSDSFTYTITDTSGNSDTATVVIAVAEEPAPPSEPNLPPDALDDAFEVGFESALASNLLGNDSDPEGDELTVTANSDPENGTVNINEDGSFTYTPNDGFSGPDTFTYTITDASGNTDTATVFITVAAEAAPPPNSSPDANSDAATVEEDTPITISVLANDTDPEGDALTVTAITQPANGTAVLNANGTVTYTPNPNYNGSDSFTYTLSDGEGGTDTATVNLTVTPVNDAPSSADVAAQSSEDADVVSVDVSSSFDDTDSTLTYSATGLPAGLSIDPVTGVIGGIIEPSASQGGAGGVYNVTVTATDGVNPPVSESFDWTVTNPGPDAVDDTQGAAEDTAVDISVLANDSDVDGDTLSIASFTQPANGTVTDNGDGTLRYTPNADYNGPDSFTYTISDGEGGTDTATVNLTVDAENDPPVSLDLNPQSSVDAEDVSVDVSGNFDDVDSTLTYSATGLPAGLSINPSSGVIAGTIDPGASQGGTAGVYEVTVTATDGINPPVSESFDWTVTNPGPDAADDAQTTAEDTPVDIVVLSNDTDPDGDALSIESFTQPGNGVVTDNGDGTLRYTPNADYNGPDSFTYTISDGQGGSDTATVTLTVDAVDDSTVSVDLSPQSSQDADAVNLNVSGNFSDVDSPLTFTATGLPAGLSIDPATGVIAGTIESGASQGGIGGVYSVTVSASDGVNPPVSESFDWTVTNPGPDAVDDSGSTDEDTAVIFDPADLLGNDSDPDGDDLSITAVGSPSNGSVVLNGDGTVTFTPDADYNGPASFDYTISDGEGGSDTATVNLTVDAANDPPVVVNPLAPQANDDADVITSVDASTAFDDVDSTLTYSATGLPAGLSIDPSSGVISGTIDNSASQSGGGVYNVTVTATDGINPPVSQSFDWTVTNPGPDAVDDTGSTDEDTAVTFDPADLLGNDSDPDGDDLTITAVGSPSNGSVVLNGDGTVTFTPDADYNGPASFDYTISDGEGGSDTATVNLTVDAANDPPVVVNPLAPQANDDADVITSVDASTAFDDVDSTLTYSATGLPAGLSIDANTGVISGTIDNSASQSGGGVYNVVVSATDGVNPPVSQSFDWTVTNPGPDAVDDTGSTDEDTAVTFDPADLLGNDSDPDGDDLTITAVGSPSNGSVVLNGDGTVTFTPDADYNGPASFDYTISDGEGGSDTATVNLTVDAANDPPVAVDDSYSVLENSTLTVDGGLLDNILANDSDGDSAMLTVGTTPILDVANGSLALNADGTFEYTPNPGFVGEDTFTYQINDGDGGTDEATVTILVTPENDPPVAIDDSDSLLLLTETSTAGNVLGNDNDPDAGPSPIQVVTPGSIDGQYGTLDLEGDGSYVYTIDAARAEAGLLGPADGLVAYWKFDSAAGSTVSDDAPTGSPTNVNLNGNTLVDGKIGNAVEFDGSGRATMPNSGEINLGTFDERTISLHFNADDTAGRQVIYEEGGGVRGLNIYIEDGELFVGGWNRQESGWNGDWISLGAVNAGDWNHVALVLDGGPTVAPGALTGYLNGVEGGSVQGSQIWPHSGDISIGGSGGNSRYNGSVQSSAANNFNGQVDDVRVYNAVLDGEEISTLAAQDGTLTEVFDYQITDGEDASNIAQLEITLLSDAVPDAQPVAVDDSFATDEDVALSNISVLGNDTLVDDAAISAFDATSANGGSVSQNSDGTFNYVPADGFSGTDTFTYTLTDADGDSSTATVTVTVNMVNTLPEAVDDSASTVEDMATSITVLDNDTDADGNTLTVESIMQPDNGTATLNGDGTVTYTPDPDYVGSDNFTYTISDGQGGTATATVNLTVDPESDFPVALDDSAMTPEDSAIVINVLGNDSDPDEPYGDVLSVGSFEQPGNGTVELNSDGTFTYTPDENFSGMDTFDYSVTDIEGNTDTATVTVNVTPVADPVIIGFPAADVIVTRSTSSVTQQINAVVGDEAGDGVIEGSPDVSYKDGVTAELDFGTVFEDAVVGVVFNVSIGGSWNFDGSGGNYDDFWEVQVGGSPQARFFYNNNIVEDGDPSPTGGAAGSSNTLSGGENFSYGSPQTGENSNMTGFTHSTPIVEVTLDSEGRAVLEFAGSTTETTEIATINSATVQLDNYLYEIPISVDLTDTDNSEVLSLQLSGVPTNSSFSSITLSNGYTLSETSSGSGVYNVEGIDASAFEAILSLSIRAPAGITPDFDLVLEASSTDATDSSIVRTETATIEIDGEEVVGSVAPVALDLDNDGVEYLSRDAGVVFEDQSTGEFLDTAWVGADDGLLVIDANQSGTVDEVREFVFTEWSPESATDMQAIAAVFDTNDNDLLDPGDARWVDFSVWKDANSDGVSDKGEMISLDDLGVDSIALSYNEGSHASTAADGDVKVHGQASVTWDDGSVSLAEDASFAISAADVLSDDGDLILPAHEDHDADVVVGNVVGAGAGEVSAPEGKGSTAEVEVAALELDLLLNSSKDDKPTTGELD